jgi:hypothetical protein
MIFEAIEAASRKARTEVGPKNDPAEQMFEMIEKRWIDFDKNNRPNLGELIVGDLETAKRFAASMERTESTLQIAARHFMRLRIDSWSQVIAAEATYLG